jgi:23S rRNA pseudouridine2605 synthase
MAFKKPGNSRDDKPRKSPNRQSGSDKNAGKSPSFSRPSGSRFKNSDNDNTSRRKFTDKEEKGDRRDGRTSQSDRPAKKSYASGEKKSYSSGERKSYSPGEKKSFSSGERKSYSSGERKSYSPGDKKSFSSGEGKSYSSGERKSYSSGERKSYSPGDKKSFSSGERKSYSSGERKNYSSGDRKGYSSGERKNRFNADEGSNRSYGERPANRGFRNNGEDDRRPAKRPEKVLRSRKQATEETEDDGLIRLNRYISNAGICSRRKADELIVAGVVTVNGEVISELGHKVDPMKDVIRYNGETLKREKMVYVLLNKPKDYITTTDDPQERRTVMQLVEKASKERIYPIGRLDRNTTGLLLLTNDGDLADKLSHPRNNILKLYQVELNKSLTQGDLNKIMFGIELEDGFIKPDMVTYVQGGTKREVGIQIHSGRNRIVRRIFEHLGYEVVKLDRTVYANLTKKDLPRGRWRYLDEKELGQLKGMVK